MISAENKKFLLDIIEEIRRIDVINRNCANLLSHIKRDCDYQHYVSLLDVLTSIDDVVRDSFLRLLDIKEELCDIQQ